MLPPQSTNTKTSSSFDFASSTKKFEGGSSTTNGGISTGSFAAPVKPTTESKKKFYDKNVSFFDNISCNALDKLEQMKEGGKSRGGGRSSRHQQRQATKELNEETFGETAVSKQQQSGRRNNYRNSGRGGGGRRNNRRNNRRTRADLSRNWRQDK